MRLGETSSIYVGERINGQAASSFSSPKKTSGEYGIFAGDLNLQSDPIAMKRKEAREKAIKIIENAAANDKIIDNDLQERREKINKLNEDIKEATKELKEIDERKTKLKEIYGITEDSQEQKDLELLEKRKDIMMGRNNDSLTEEDTERLKEIGEEGLTEYQERSLELGAGGEPYKEIIKNAEKGIIEENAIIRGVKIEQLKSTAMIDAVKEAEIIEDAASKEIVGMLIEEAKEHVDEELKEEIEAAKEKAKEKAKEEETLETIKERQELLEELAGIENENKEKKRTKVDVPTEEILDLNHTKINTQTEVENIVDEMKLVIEDIKGTVVDSLL